MSQGEEAIIRRLLEHWRVDVSRERPQIWVWTNPYSDAKDEPLTADEVAYFVARGELSGDTPPAL